MLVALKYCALSQPSLSLLSDTCPNPELYMGDGKPVSESSKPCSIIGRLYGVGWMDRQGQTVGRAITANVSGHLYMSNHVPFHTIKA